MNRKQLNLAICNALRACVLSAKAGVGFKSTEYRVRELYFRFSEYGFGSVALDNALNQYFHRIPSHLQQPGEQLAETIQNGLNFHNESYRFNELNAEFQNDDATAADFHEVLEEFISVGKSLLESITNTHAKIAPYRSLDSYIPLFIKFFREEKEVKFPMAINKLTDAVYDVVRGKLFENNFYKTCTLNDIKNDPELYAAMKVIHEETLKAYINPLVDTLELMKTTINTLAPNANALLATCPNRSAFTNN